MAAVGMRIGWHHEQRQFGVGGPDAGLPKQQPGKISKFIDGRCELTRLCKKVQWNDVPRAQVGMNPWNRVRLFVIGGVAAVALALVASLVLFDAARDLILG
jgi:hypothetical protein